MEEEKKESRDLAEVGRYLRLSDANERALVILAMGLGYWLFREDDFYVLCVQTAHYGDVARELEKFEFENPKSPLRETKPLLPEKTPTLSLFLYAWMMSHFFLAYQSAPESWMQKGELSSDAIMHHGQWWRTVTALTLHADLGHLIANLATGILFAAFLLPLLGTGLTWFSILLTGALGNYLNAWCYRDEIHLSIGASTAVFGSLGILVACQTLSTFGANRRARLWEIILPVGAGLALLAWLGHGDARTDFMAHFWGFASGCFTGAVIVQLRLKSLLSPLSQNALAGFALLLPFLAWVWAESQS